MRQWGNVARVVEENGHHLEVMPRSAWTDTGPTVAPESEEVRFLLVHHTAGSTSHEPGAVPGLLEGIRRFHVDTKGWPDIAYNFMIDRYGTVWEARAGSLDGPVRGDATGGNQGFSQLVCLLGDFTDRPPTQEAQDALVAVLAWLADRYDVELGPDTTISFASRGSNRWPEGTEVTTTPVAGHRDMSHTSCPGDAFYPLLASSISPRVANLAAGPATTTTTEPDPTTTTTEPDPTTTTTEPDPTTTTSTAPSTSTTTPTPGSTVRSSSTSTVSAAAPGENGIDPGWSIATIAGGLLGALVAWRMRRMGRSEHPD